jgi:hypothetical protein
MPLASEILLRSAALLNDPGQQIFTNAVLLPYLKIAWDELQDDMMNNGIPTIKEATAALEIAAGVSVISSSSVPVALPENLVEPIELHEKAPGEDDSYYRLMTPKSFSPDIEPGSTLRYWAWNDEEIQFPPASTSRIVRIRYQKSLPTITGESTNIAVRGAVPFLATKTAAYAAEFIGQNLTRSSSLRADAEKNLAKFRNIRVRGLQGIKTTRIPYGASRRKRRWISRM